MKFKMLLFSLILVSSNLPALSGASAQGCKVELLSGPGGIIIDIFNGPTCNAVTDQCNSRLRQLRLKEPYFYRDAYCNGVPPSSVTPPPGSDPQPAAPPPPYVTRTYSRCQAPDLVRCAQEWSNGRVVIEEHPCPGCQRYGTPVAVPCGWNCSFPKK